MTERVYADSFRIGFGMTLTTGLWWMIEGGVTPLIVAVLVSLASLFVFPWVLVWRRSS